jgi:hypothetical protein
MYVDPVARQVPRLLRALACLTLALPGLQVHAQEASAQALALQYQRMQQQPGSSMLGVPSAINSLDQEEQLHGEVYALLDKPFASLQQHMVMPSQWCQMILLHLYISACTSGQTGGHDWLTFYSGGKANVLLEKAYPLRFHFQVNDASAAHMEVLLRAEQGPYGTSDYRISLSAIPVAQGSFLRLNYSFRSSTASRLATRVYLATAGRDKIGFTVQGQADDGSPRYLDGARGIAERNAVRYYLALQAHMESLETPADQRFAFASARWFDLTERFAAQLHEVERPDYLTLKKQEAQAQDRLQKKLDTQNPTADPQTNTNTNTNTNTKPTPGSNP